jgi:hypothetical protein
MNKSFAEFLTDQRADADTIQQAARYYLGEVTDDLSPEEMRRELKQAAGDPAEVDRCLRSLERDTGAVRDAALTILADRWSEPGEAERIASIVEDAKGKLAVIEISIMAIVAMYGMYLATTGGRKTSTTIVRQKPDGTFEEIETTEWEPPSGPLRAVVDLFRAGGGKS